MRQTLARVTLFAAAGVFHGGVLADVRLTNDFPGGGYISAYTLATGNAYSDATLAECSRSRGRQNEPAVAVNPRNIDVLIGSSNDYCGVYNDGNDSNGAPIASGPVWLGYYRSEDGGHSFRSSLVPGYPGDASPYAALARVRTSGAGDPVIAWDAHGRVFMGSENSGDPEGSPNIHTAPKLIDDRAIGHQTFPDISADGGVLHVLWWDSRADLCYSAARPIGNCANLSTVASLDVWGTRSTNHGDSWISPTRLTAVTSNPNYEQFDGRSVPFGGDYLWITSMGTFSFGAWTDWRNTVAG